MKHNAAEVLDNDEPLLPWMVKVALWGASQPKKPTRKQWETRARFESKISRMTLSTVTRLLARKDFQELIAQVQRDESEKAKQVIKSQMVEAVETHFDAMKQLQARGEYKEISKFTTPYIDRAYPVKQQQETQPQTIVIAMQGGNSFATKYLDATDEPEIIVEPQ